MHVCKLLYPVKPKFHGTIFRVASSRHPREDVTRGYYEYATRKTASVEFKLNSPLRCRVVTIYYRKNCQSVPVLQTHREITVHLNDAAIIERHSYVGYFVMQSREGRSPRGKSPSPPLPPAAAIIIHHRCILYRQRVTATNGARKYSMGSVRGREYLVRSPYFV